MQTTATRTAGSHTDLLTGILNVQVRNEDKITEQDRQYCQLQQDQLYRTLDRIDRWYDIFKEEAERYREIVSDCSTTSCVFDFLLRCTPL